MESETNWRGGAIARLSAEGAELTEYQVEAGIAAVHATSPAIQATNWQEIVSLYDALMTIQPNSNCGVKSSNCRRAARWRRLRTAGTAYNSGPDRLAKYPFYHAHSSSLSCKLVTEDAIGYFEIALKLARNPMERQFFENRIVTCRQRAR